MEEKLKVAQENYELDVTKKLKDQKDILAGLLKSKLEE